MKPKLFLTLIIAASCYLVQNLDVWAQTPNPSSPLAAQSVGRGQPTRINVNFRIEIDGETGDLAATEKARKTLYSQAARECSVLTASFSGTSCLMENLSVMFQRDGSVNRGSAFLNGNAVYQLRAD
ncbi:hypothetical protein AB6806_22700 [Bosea sp. RCC_152_1]|uniref:hypothetical protein n=1 Tax=Bosea sp. RCC_152_1 TaxID=3239228 RepID=UPI003524CA9E